MSYEFHITRSDSWLDDDSPVTLSEIETTLCPLPENFTIDRSGFVSTVTPNGKTLTAAVGDYLIYDNPGEPDSRVHIYFRPGFPPFFSIASPEHLLPIIDLAEKLGVKVQGDELEIYSREDIPGLINRHNKAKAKAENRQTGFFGRIRNYFRKLQ